MRKLGQIVPHDAEERKKRKGHLCIVQNLFFYYHARPDIFKEFESKLNLSALKAGQPIKKISTFRGNNILKKFGGSKANLLDLPRIPHMFLKQATVFFKEGDFRCNQSVWEHFANFFSKGNGRFLLKTLEKRKRPELFGKFWPKIERVCFFIKEVKTLFLNVICSHLPRFS